MHTLWRNTYYIGSPSFSPILAIDANGGEVLREFRGNCLAKFRESLWLFGFMLWFVPKHLHLCVVTFAWLWSIPYINSLESDCHQLPKWGRLKEHAVPPCLVLVIDDNLYGLMVALSYIRRICP